MALKAEDDCQICCGNGKTFKVCDTKNCSCMLCLGCIINIQEMDVDLGAQMGFPPSGLFRITPKCPNCREKIVNEFLMPVPVPVPVPVPFLVLVPVPVLVPVLVPVPALVLVPVQEWVCQNCSLINDKNLLVCEVCEARRLTWVCQNCSLINDKNLLVCEVCEARRLTWVCPQCIFENDAEMHYCERCSWYPPNLGL